MKLARSIMAALTAVTGIIAARLWLKASKVQVEPMWGDTEPGDDYLSHRGWTTGTIQAFNASGSLNARAARWTAVSVALSGAASVIGSFYRMLCPVSRK